MGLKEKVHLVGAAARVLAVDRDPEQWRSLREADFYRRMKIPTVSLRELIAEIGEASSVSIPGPTVQTEEMGGTVGYFVIGSVARAKQPKTVVEFGTYLGVGTLTLAMNAPRDSRIFTIDLPEDFQSQDQAADRKFVESSRHRVGERFLCQPDFADRITQLRADSRTLRLADHVKSADLILIDGGHTYEIVKADTGNAMSVLAPDGVILWDDYAIFWEDHVVRYVDSLIEGGLKLRRIAGTGMVAGCASDFVSAN
jgi:predicted O-methyltransferase YrrM